MVVLVMLVMYSAFLGMRRPLTMTKSGKVSRLNKRRMQSSKFACVSFSFILERSVRTHLTKQSGASRVPAVTTVVLHKGEEAIEYCAWLSNQIGRLLGAGPVIGPKQCVMHKLIQHNSKGRLICSRKLGQGISSYFFSVFATAKDLKQASLSLDWHFF